MRPIDVNFDFTTDTPGFWNGFWASDDDVLGHAGADPDLRSPTLREYHRLLWSRPLPNGETMQLSRDPDGSLSWNGMRFASDSITTSFRFDHTCTRALLAEVAASMGMTEYRAFMEDYHRRAYTIGGAIIFPKHQPSMNQARGRSPKIRDRWDLTLECIRRYYAGEDSPLSEACARDRVFLDLFVDFDGYVEFFLLQDCLNPDGSVRFRLGSGDFTSDPLPATVDEYLSWIDSQLSFVSSRNRRIEALFA
ncbi:MAG: hypothetical protein IKD70_00370 [Eggerthellaceae bacterium]|nr:hypothetical protein [Eggerthellaceae bacterium]